jgi:4-hydroxy-tetrahydrodipicolinate synthase
MIEAFPGFDVFAGSEEFLLPTLRLGGPGCMSATVNLLAPQSAELYAKWRDAEADALQERLTALRLTISKYPPIPAMKGLLARQSGQAAWAKVRPPLVALDAAQIERLAADLAAMGLDLPAAA